MPRLTSTAIIAMGVLVLQKRIAPLARMILVISDSPPIGVGLFTLAVKPMVASRPSIWKQSLSETGSPWRGPSGRPLAR